MFTDDAQFHKAANTVIEALAETLDDAVGDTVDVDVENEILTLVLPDGGHYIVNKNAPFHQIWLSSPRSGAWHFDWADNDWRSTHDAKRTLGALLAEEIAAATGTSISFG